MTNPGSYEVLEHDVLVIGAGGAGLRAAVEASRMGSKVALVCKYADVLQVGARNRTHPSVTKTNVAATAVAGVLVGFGARLGNGCTSGHGVCGMARFSKRSIVATLVFMATAAITVLATRAWLGGGT